MRRLARHVSTFCSAASLLLCLAVCVSWIRSLRSFDHVRYGRRPLAVEVESKSGLCRAACTTEWPGNSYGWATRHEPADSVAGGRGRSLVGACKSRAGPFGWGIHVRLVGPRGARQATPT